MGPFSISGLKFFEKRPKRPFSTNENRASDVAPGLRSEFQPLPLLVRDRVCYDFRPLKQGWISSNQDGDSTM